MRRNIIKMTILGSLLGIMTVSGFPNGRMAKAEVIAGDSMNDAKEAKSYSEKAILQQVLRNEIKVSPKEKEALDLKSKIVNGELTQEELNDMLYGNIAGNNYIVNQNSVYAKAATNELVVNLRVKQYEQKNGHYCGPATTKQTLQYLLNQSPSQDKIAEKIGTTTAGTDGTMIVNYLNKKQNKRFYMISDDTDKMNIQSRIVCALNTGVKTPAIARLKFTKGGSWAYSTDGHYLNIAGYNVGMTIVKIVDPNITRVKASASGSYKVKFSELQKALKAHWLHHLYW